MSKQPINSEMMAALAAENADMKKGRPWQKTLKSIKKQPNSMFPNNLNAIPEVMPPAELRGVWGGENENVGNLFPYNPAAVAVDRSPLNLAAERAAAKKPRISNFSMDRGSGSGSGLHELLNLSRMTGAKAETIEKAMKAGSDGSNAALIAAASLPSKKRTRNARNNPNNTRNGAGGAAAKSKPKALVKKPNTAVGIAAAAAAAGAGAGAAISIDSLQGMIIRLNTIANNLPEVTKFYREFTSTYPSIPLTERAYLKEQIQNIANRLPVGSNKTIIQSMANYITVPTASKI